MYIDIIPNKSANPAVLLRESYREDGKVKKRTLANLSQLPQKAIDTLRQTLKGQDLVTVKSFFAIEKTTLHGHVQAVALAMKRLRIGQLLLSKKSAKKNNVLAMIAARIIQPQSKLATTRWWETTTLPEEFEVVETTPERLYASLDWLEEAQPRIEKKLAKRHLRDGQLVLYDLSSSYVEGTCCPLAKRGYSRDKKKGKLQVNYGLLTDKRGCPVAIEVFEGNMSDSKTFMKQVDRLEEKFGIKKIVITGDRGMIVQSHLDAFKERDAQLKQFSQKTIEEESLVSIKAITGLKTVSIKKLVKQGTIQMSLFDKQNLASVTHDDYPGERLIVCKNPLLATRREKTRQELLAATEKKLDVIATRVEKRKIVGKDEIGISVGKEINRYKVGKHFKLDITDNSFSYERDKEKIEEEANLDGIYVIRTTLDEEEMNDQEVVRSYKQLSMVEQAFRNMKTDALRIRPFFHYSESRVRAHIFLCMLAYYVRWHMEQALAKYLFVDEEKDSFRDPVTPAEPSKRAKQKCAKKELPDGTPIHSFETLLGVMTTITKNECRFGNAKTTITHTTNPNPYQRKILEQLKTIPKL